MALVAPHCAPLLGEPSESCDALAAVELLLSPLERAETGLLARAAGRPGTSRRKLSPQSRVARRMAACVATSWRSSRSSDEEAAPPLSSRQAELSASATRSQCWACIRCATGESSSGRLYARRETTSRSLFG